MNRNTLLILATIAIIPACSSLSLSQYTNIYASAKDSIFNSDVLEVSLQEYDAFNYSFAKVKIGRGQAITMSLSSIDGDQHIWVSSDSSKIITEKGRIIKTIGLSNDMRRSSSAQYSESNDSIASFETITLYDPSLIGSSLLSQVTTNSGLELTYLDKMIDVYVLEEEFSLLSIQWTGLNKYFFNLSGSPVLTQQQTHPFMKPISIKFYYK
jgi:hypothetical protein